MPAEPARATVHHLRPRNGATPIAAEPVSEELVETVAGLLIRLRDIGRDVTARATVSVIPDAELVLAGQRVEYIAGRLYSSIFAIEAPE